MPILNLSIDALLTTTRTVRKRLNLARPVEPEVIRECLELALQAPTASYSQDWHFVVVTDPHQRQALATIYRKGAARYVELMAPVFQQRMASSEQEAGTLARVIDSGQYLIEHLHEVPVHVIPCIQGRTEHLPIIAQAARWGSIMPAAWSFMLAARSRGLGSSLTSFHLFFEQEAAQVLGIPYEEVMQAGLIPVAYAPVDLGKLHTVKYLLCGAAPLPLEPARQLQDRTGIHVIQGYGMTEALNQESVRRNDRPRRFNAFLTTS